MPKKLDLNTYNIKGDELLIKLILKTHLDKGVSLIGHIDKNKLKNLDLPTKDFTYEYATYGSNTYAIYEISNNNDFILKVLLPESKLSIVMGRTSRKYKFKLHPGRSYGGSNNVELNLKNRTDKQKIDELMSQSY